MDVRASHPYIAPVSFEPGEYEVSPIVATIEMKGHVTLPTYSVTFYKFAFRH